MNRNNYLRHNPQRYEQHLTLFGKKVLQVLGKHWDKRDAAPNQNRNEYQHDQHRRFSTPQYKKVITFNDVSVVNTPYTPRIPSPSIVCERAYTEDLTENSEPECPGIPRSVELVKTIPTCYNKDNFLHPTIAANKKPVYDIYNQVSDDDRILEEVIRNNSTGTNKDINWDDVLDSELFLDMAPCEVENKESKVKAKIIDTPNITEGKGNRGQKRKSKKSIDNKIKKVRKEISPVEKILLPIEFVNQTNILITDNLKNNFRKQKYTKAVKTWLDNVQHHPVDEDIVVIANKDNLDCNENNALTDNDYSEINKKDQETRCNKNLRMNKDIIVIDKTPKIVKKVVQAQLANKDGVMKFSKPKNVIEEIKKDTTIKETKPNDNNEKKVKKFVAPIKSQIPVKDVTYEICHLNENNIENYVDKLREITNNEIVAVLMYSNGFCQLNSQHTDGTCAPDGIIINIDEMFYCFKNAEQKLKEILKHVFEVNKVVCYGGRSVLIYLASYLGTEVNSIRMYDAKIGASLLDPDNPPENFTDLQKLVSFTAPYTIATECVLQKCAWYMTLLKECWTKLYGMLVDEALWKVFIEIEMKLLPVIADMERRGVSIDLVKLKSMEEILLTRMKLVEQQCYKAAGKAFQINSAVQVRAILYDELKLDTKCNIKIRETLSKGAKSTSETMLRSLISEHPLPKLILEYRHLHKAHATYLTGIAQHVKDGVVRPTWEQMAAATGRIASNNPNLQAIPKAPFSLAMFPEAGDSDTEQLMFRSVYVSREGQSLVAADFKHVECRVFAHAAADTQLLHALGGAQDLFRVLAAKWLKKAEAEVVAEEREQTKRLVYASLYGAGARKLMDILNVDYQQALQIAASFNSSFPSLKAFGRGVGWRCERARGRLATPCGRVRRVPHIASRDFALKSHAQRQALNFLVQGSAADLCKMAMILTEERLRNSSPPVSARLVLQIHDELVWEVADHDVDRAAGIIKQVMECCGQHCGMAVSLPVAISVGKNWGHMDEYIPTD